MMLVFWSWAATVGLELVTYMSGVGRLQRFLAYPVIFLNAAASGMLLLWRPNVFSGLIVLISLYRMFNQLRIIEQRMHEGFLRRTTRRTGLRLMGLQVLLGVGWLIWQRRSIHGDAFWAMVTAIQLFAALVLLVSTSRRLKRTAWPARAKLLTDNQLPTLTVAIPARNETEDLEECLQSVIASDYAKLEIVVLDDCSQIKRTPEIIRSFAHDGVRFVQGQDPHPTWLPKNQAYARLVEEASGDYILFCGVDIRFTPDALRQIVSTMQARNKQMMSILPLRGPGTPALVQAMRYFWELVPPRRLFRRPPVLSSCWVISAKALRKAGGFQAVTRSIVPEAHFAKELLKTDGYSFMRAGRAPGVMSSKGHDEQRDTAIRMRYPQVHRRPENVVIGALAALSLLVLPFVLAVGGFWLPIGIAAHILAILASAALIIMYELMGLSTHVTTWWFGLIALPIVVLYDVVLVHASMWQYEFSVVDWKGRNICIPAMHVIPHLPKID